MQKFVIFKTGEGTLLGEFSKHEYANSIATKYNDNYNKKYNKPPKKGDYKPITIYCAKELRDNDVKKNK